MWTQQSYREKRDAGTLYLVPTPIGNLEDITFRAVRILKEADLIAAEDTRNTKKLCNHFEIDTPLVSYHEHNKETGGEKLIAELESGKTVALVSDAGMPAISDPGRELVKACAEREVFVVSLPGANAGLSALIASGLDTKQFFFYGFLPRSKNDRKQELEYLKTMTATLIFYEAPHRMKETVTAMAEQLGDRQACVAREMTKRYEEWMRGSLYEIKEKLKEEPPKGEFCLIVEGGAEEEADEKEMWWNDLTIEEHVRHYVEIRGMRAKEAVKEAARDRGIPKREAYNAYHVGK
ncbi:MAG TPA: 16S rRNA (cytidine(1402)-2'-O)-methyltransferase [Bacillales bacterium]|nr:16S rRNA (cytidine(1402)-2'-O)-methyltransferase [Bacillales bacterium]